MLESKLKIGFVEDDDIIKSVFQDYFECKNFEVFHSYDLSGMDKFPKDLDGLVTDGQLGNGVMYYDVIKNWYDLGYKKPFIILTASDDIIFNVNSIHTNLAYRKGDCLDELTKRMGQTFLKW